MQSPTSVLVPFWTIKNCTQGPIAGINPGGQLTEMDPMSADVKVMFPPFGVSGAETEV